MTVSGVTLSGGYNDTASGGAINKLSADLTIRDTTISGSSTGGTGAGGALFSNGATTTIERSTISGNSANNQGGGIFTENGALTIENSTISGNSTTSANDYSFGGGLGALNASTTIRGSTVSGNSTAGTYSDGGGLWAYLGTLTIENSTISGNSTTGVYSNGGGISLYVIGGTTLTVRNTTIADNHAADASSKGGGISSYGSPSGPILSNSIVADNSAGGTAQDLSSSTDTFQAAFSLIEDPSGAAINATVPGSNIFTVDPVLMPLADNGGPTETQALSAASQAIDCGSSDGATADQRGSTRPVDLPGRTNSTAAIADGADMGAFELQTGAPSGACPNDAPPAPPPPTSTPATATPTPVLSHFNLKKAIKRCKKKFRGRAEAKQRKKCIRKARRRARA